VYNQLGTAVRPADPPGRCMDKRKERIGEEMKTVYSASNISLVSVFQSLLEGHGIKCWIKNEYLIAGIGEIPPIECWPQLCVNDEDFAEAKRIVEEELVEKDMASWKCSSCGEEIEGQFAVCWNCGKSDKNG
jgi:Putative prokaryotic signal transducing protein